MRDLFKSWIESSRAPQGDPAPVLELLVHEGDDAGERFTLDGDEIPIGRQQAAGEPLRGIRLRDPTVSAHQAVITRQGSEWILSHSEGATNPTLLDGEAFDQVPLRVGSSVRIGRVLLEVCERAGIAISDLTGLFSEGSISGLSTTNMSTGEEDPDEITRVRPVTAEWGQLLVERGQAAGSGGSFGIGPVRTTLGRSESSHVQLHDMGVSRLHAELVFEGEELLLIHKSLVNVTLLNGSELSEPTPVRHGDVIQLADRVVLRVHQHSAVESEAEQTSPSSRLGGLGKSLEERVGLDREIEQRYSVEGSFLDLDVVNSYGMKTESQRPDHIVVSFERFRKYVSDVTEEHSGFVLNSNGDELMCFFESALGAVEAGVRVLAGLDDFNRNKNLLGTPFQFRIGIHTGRSLVDLDHGVAYSPVLDSAGHLQKLAEPNGLLISDSTREALASDLPFERVGTVERGDFAYYRLAGEWPQDSN